MKGSGNRRNRLVMAVLGLTITCALLITGVASAAPLATLRLSGSTTVYPVCNDSRADFEAAYPGNDLSIAQGGSGVGIQDILNNRVEVAMSSRATTTSDNRSGNSFLITDLDDALIAKDAVCIIVNVAQTGVTNITRAQVKSIYEGTVDWSVIGGTGGNIVPRARVYDSGTRVSTAELASFAKCGSSGQPACTGTNDFPLEVAKITATGLPRLDGNPDMVTAVANNPNQIAYVGLAFINDNPSVKAIQVEGVAPSVLTVENGTFPMSRDLHLYTLKPGVDPDYMPLIQDYLNFMKGPKGQAKVISNGFVSTIAPSWDVNVDGRCSIGDVAAIGLQWGRTGAPGWLREDVNKDGRISIGDVAAVGLSWASTWS